MNQRPLSPRAFALAALVCAAVGMLVVLLISGQAEGGPSPQAAGTASLAGWGRPAFLPSTTTSTVPPTTTTVARSQPAPKATAHPPHYVLTSAPSGGFAACVRQHESSGNYAYNDGTYHGAYNMTTEHWGGYGGYASPEDAPPSVQDQKFASDAAQGSAYLHQQYPVTSRACGG